MEQWLADWATCLSASFQVDASEVNDPVIAQTVPTATGATE
ncbi:hypothetical protein [Ensifer canadensis]